MENKDTAQAAAEAAQPDKTGKADAAKKDKSAKKAKDKKPGFFDRLKRWFREMKSELKKVVWPNKQTVVKNTGTVLLCSAIIGAFIWVFDFVSVSLVQMILSVFGA